MGKFKKGDKVYIADDSVYKKQAIKDGKKMIGVVTTPYYTGEWSQVQWEDGSNNSYKDEDLIHVSETLNMTITEINGFKIGDLVEACQTGSGIHSNYLGKQFTIVEFGSYGGEQGVKLRKDDGEIYENIIYDNFVSINSIRKVSTKEVVTKSYVDAIEPERVVTFMVDGETLQYQLESKYYNRDGDNNTIFEFLGVNKYDFCSKAYGYKAGSGDWPTWNYGDTEAPIKIVRAIREEISKREKQSTKPDLDGLLEEAKRKYPIGTQYMSLNVNGEPHDEETAIRECKWIYDGARGPVGIDCGPWYVYVLKSDTWAEVVTQKVKSDGIDYDTILAEAKRRYPVGTKYIPLSSNGTEWSGEHSSNFECKWYARKSDGRYYDGIECGNGLVYWNGKWADVVTQKVIDYDTILAEAKRRYPIGTKYKPLGEQGNTYLSLSQVAERECKWVASRHGIDCGVGYVYVNGKWAEVVTEDSIPDDELLAEAKRRYPVGTKYICASESRQEYTVTSQYFSMPDPLTVFGEEDKGCLYYNGKWAEVISEHTIVSDDFKLKIDMLDRKIIPIVTNHFDDFKPEINMLDSYSASTISIGSYSSGVIIGSNGNTLLPEHQTAIILPKKEKKSKIVII